MLREIKMKYLLIIMCVLLLALITIEPDTIDKRMSLVESLNEQLEPTKAVAQYCDKEHSDLSKIYCVNDYVLNILNYSKSNSIKNIHSLINTGGECKSYSNFYKSVFNLMGIESQYVYLPTHVFVTAYTDNIYCNLDMQVIECKEFMKGENK